jgi:hypothetical protein
MRMHWLNLGLCFWDDGSRWLGAGAGVVNCESLFLSSRLVCLATLGIEKRRNVMLSGRVICDR